MGKKHKKHKKWKWFFDVLRYEGEVVKSLSVIVMNRQQFLADFDDESANFFVVMWSNIWKVCVKKKNVRKLK